MVNLASNDSKQKPIVLTKEVYNKETIAALNYEIQQMSFIPPSMQLK